MFKKLLIAVDGSQSSRHACEAIANLGLAAEGNQVELIGVFEVDQLSYTELLELSDEVLMKGRERFRLASVEPARRLLEGLDVYVTSEIVEPGDPAERIAARAAEAGAELIVVGRRDLGRAAHAILGSVSERLLALARRPLLVIPEGFHETGPLEAIVVGTDLSEASWVGVQAAAQLARDREVRLVLAHAFAAVDLLPGPFKTELTGLPANITELYDGLRAEKRRWLAERAEELTEGGVPTSWRLEDGGEAEVLARVAEEERAGIVAIASHGRSGFQRLWLGNTAARMLRHAEVGILVIPILEDAS